MGGLVVLNTVLRHKKKLIVPLSGVILSNPCLKVKMPVNSWMRGGLAIGKGLMNNLRIPSVYKGDHLTHDENKSREFDTDPLISRFMTLNLMSELLTTSETIRTMSYFLDIPSLFLVSGEDELVDAATTKLFFKGCDKKMATLHFYDKLKHEIFNEIQADIAFSDLKNWMDGVIEGESS